jgi:predicted ATPase/class 3 adenylate cyclase
MRVDIGAWLHGLGLDQYERAFRANDIDGEILPRLTAEDLAALGVGSVGHRRKLLEAIGTLSARARPERRSRAAEGARQGWSPDPAPDHQAGRRQLTVMFAHLVGSTALSGRLDPEEMREVLSACQEAVCAEVTRFGGHVAKLMGDGVLAFFGWPQAYEDAAERAVRAGLAAVAAVGQLQTGGGEALAVRVGIATGLVVVGHLAGRGAAREEDVAGATPNLAARLQELAGPGVVIVAERTRRLLGGLFKLEAVAAAVLKGLPEPVPAYRVLGEGEAESRFEALRGADVIPLVGRAHELALILDRWGRAEEGEGQVVLLAGEAGIGKSRLVRALREHVAGEPHTPLSHFCSPFHQTSALYPTIDLLERAAGFARDDDPPEKLAKLEALLAQASAGMALPVPLFTELLSIPTKSRYPPLRLSPQRQKERTLEALVEQLTGLARHRPMLAVYEDVHWADPTTLELLDQVVDRVQALPALVIVTFRPEFAPRWTGRGHVTLLTLSRLGRHEGAALVEQVAGGKPLPAEVLQQIVAKTDGVPLFLEELTKSVLESGLLRDEGDSYVLSGPLPPLAIPATLHDSLLARLDRLAPVREVAQIGACIGRVFSHALLAAVAPLGEDQLREALAQLCRSELVFCRGTTPEVAYSFKHALVQDAAYRSLLRSRRQQLHAHIVEVLEQRFPETMATEPEVLAHHCAQARLVRQAIGYWLKAGDVVIRRSATAEAIARLTKGLELVESLTDDPERAGLELELRTALGGALIAARGFGAPEVGDAFARARELCRQLGRPPQLFPVLYGQYVFQLASAELDRSLKTAEELLHAAQEQDETAPQVMGHRAIGFAAFFRGEPARSREHLERALALYDPQQHRAQAFLYVFDPFVASASCLSWALFALGHPEQAQARAKAVLAQARELGHPASLAFGLFFAGSALSQFIGDRMAVQEQAAALVALASEQGFAYWSGCAMVLEGWALADQGRASEGTARIRQGIAAYRATGSSHFDSYFLALLAQAQHGGGQVAEAETTVAEALDHVHRTGEEYYEAELFRLRGELLLAKPLPDLIAAEQCLVKALETARRQRARMWELRAARSLACLWRDQERRVKAHDLLAAVYGWFDEGFDTFDLREAKALLQGLTSSLSGSWEGRRLAAVVNNPS